jgi:hypothetical protein
MEKLRKRILIKLVVNLDEKIKNESITLVYDEHNKI